MKMTHIFWRSAEYDYCVNPNTMEQRKLRFFELFQGVSGFTLVVGRITLLHFWQ